MIRTRVIPCLLMKGQGLVKTVNFSDPRYIGDPLNAVKILNDKEVHELVFLDISATPEGKSPRLDYISDISSECFMPLGYGGGIRNVKQAEDIFSLGVEKVIINSFASDNLTFIQNLADLFGSQSIVVSIDVKKNLFGGYKVFTHGGRKKTMWDPDTYAQEAEKHGAGEILLTSIDREGTMSGYDIPLIKSVSDSVTIPVIASGGAGNVEDFPKAVRDGGASAVAAGSMFVYYGKHRAILISFPEDQALISSGLQ